MSSNQRWRIFVENLETRVRIGIHEHERDPQRILVSAVIEADYSRRPQSIKECFDYDHLHRVVVEEWPHRSHVMLLETAVTELLESIFAADDRVVKARVSIRKPDIFVQAQAVGVEAEWTRADYERHLPKM